METIKKFGAWFSKQNRVGKIFVIALVLFACCCLPFLSLVGIGSFPPTMTPTLTVTYSPTATFTNAPTITFTPTITLTSTETITPTSTITLTPTNT